jgi:16S rRNA (uracil1498-N3)-methyltransferase
MSDPSSEAPATSAHGRTPRLHCDADLAQGRPVPLGREQSHYLVNVLRLADGAPVLAFNGRDGEWLASLRLVTRKAAELVPEHRTRAQPTGTDLHYLFAPLKQARLDYMVQKAVEMGASRLQPVLTQHTQVSRINTERMKANAVEAAEQCGILALPEIAGEIRFDRMLAGWPAERRLIFCDEGAPVGDAVAALRAVERGPLAVLIGPEGGFSEAERTQLLRLPHVTRLSLGPRILRADTAAVAALALVQAVLGDWPG